MAISHVVTDAGPGVEGASPPYVPAVPVFSGNDAGSIDITLGANGNSAEVEYAIRVITDGFVGYVQASGAVLENAVAVSGTTYYSFEPAGAGNSEIYDTANGFLSAGFEPGMIVSVTCPLGSVYWLPILAVSADKITFDGAMGLYTFDVGETVTIEQKSVLAYQTLTEWGDPVTVTGLNDFTPYTFAARARSEDEAKETAWSAESAEMNTVPAAGLDYGIEQQTGAAREITSADVRVDADVGIAVDTTLSTAVPEVADTEYTGVIFLSYLLKSVDGQTANVLAHFSEDGGATWNVATHYTGGGGDGTTGLSTSRSGVTHTFAWDSETDAGESEYQDDVMFRIAAKDSSGNWSEWVTSAAFTVRNLPGELVFAASDSSTWGSDTTPVFVADMPSLRGGSVGFPEIYIYDVDAASTLLSGYPKKSVESQTGWEYSVDGTTWIQMTCAGIPSNAYMLRYTVQSALTSGIKYKATGRMAEVRERG